MKKIGKVRITLSILIVLIAVSAAYAAILAYSQAVIAGSVKAPRLIAHAGGDVYGVRLTNSLQAMNQSYKEGFRFIETDFSLTSDNVPVLVHDWGNANWLMNVKYSTKQQSYEDFKSLKTILGLQLMDLDMLAEWLREHNDAYIVTDVKEDNLVLLETIQKEYPDISSQIIPQIYSFEEYEPVSSLGYSYIILTLYKLKVPDEDVLRFCEDHPLFGITMSSDRAVPEVLKKYSALKLPVYVHTINDYNAYIKYRDSGAYGVYTDYFQVNNWVE